MPFAVWITGLPGSGKSTIAKELIKRIKGVEYLRLDEIRKKYISDPKFTDEEREFVYSKFIDDGAEKVKQGKNVIFDATANKLIWRKKARSKIEKFAEVYVKCSISSCMERENKREGGLVLVDLYRKSLERKKTGKEFEGLGKVVGVDVPFEENSNAEITIDSETTKPEEAAGVIFNEIKKRGWIK
jgi:adenylylsulfate kinase